MADKPDHKSLLTDFIKRQMVVLGPNIALDAARKVAGLIVSDEGEVTGLSGDFDSVLKSLAAEFSSFSEFAAEASLGSLQAVPKTK